MAPQIVNASETHITMVPPLIPVPKGLAKPTDKLCDSCTALKLTPQDFVVRPGEDDKSIKRYKPDVKRHFGLIKDVKKKSSHCSLCRLVLRVLGPDAPAEEEGIALEVIFYWSTDGPARNPDAPWDRIPIVREIGISTERRGGGMCDYFPGFNTRLGILANDAPIHSKSYLSRVIKDQIDFSMVRNWITICNERHKNQCAGVHPELEPLKLKDALDEIPSLRMIDVVNNCIVPTPRSCKYVALSYVWGRIDPQTILRSLKSNIAQLEKPGALVLPEHNDKIPLTIRDAMYVVKELGMRYLWVDSLCIVQDDDGPNGSKMQSIAKMAVVYGAAALTITAAAGVGANAGLPGVHAGADRSQPIEEIQPGFRLAFKQMYQYYISASTYYTRGWTYQEQCLTKRNLIFIGGQVLYICAMTDQCREDEVIEDLHANATGNGVNFRTDDIGEVEENIYEYSNRSLTYDGDIYHAFAAITTVFQRVLNANLCHGIPDVIFDWFLLWEPEALQKRRGKAPSWSWSGWVGRSSPNIWDAYTRSIVKIRRAQKKRTWIVWYQRAAHDSPECVRVNTVKTPSEDSAATKRMQKRFAFDCSQTLPTPRKLTDAPVYIEDTHYPRPGSGFLQFWTISVMFDLEQAAIPAEYTEKNRLFGHSCAGIFGRDGRQLGFILVDPDWFAANVPGRHEFIVLCEGRTERVKHDGDEDKEPGWKYRVMLIDWRGEQWAERVAIGAIEKEDLFEGLGAGAVWKEIVLG